MNIVEDVLDFLAFLFFLGLCLVVGLGLVMPVVYENPEHTSVGFQDKTSPVIMGDKVDSSYDGTISRLEAVLYTQVQDFDMPSPKKYRVESATDTRVWLVDIASQGAYYKSSYNMNKNASDVFTVLNGDTSNNKRYEIVYNTNGTEDKTDDFYSFKERR